MGFLSWAKETKDRIQSEGTPGIYESAYWLYVGAAGRLRLLRPGTSVYERDWDMLVLLDGCRVDTLDRVSDEFDFLGEVERHTSVGSTSREWLANTFDGSYPDEEARTVYVTGNIYTDEFLTENRLQELVEVWRTNWDDEIGTVRPRNVTDAAIQKARESNPDRLIVHYMQPHYPFLTQPNLAPGMKSDDPKGNVWTQLRRGEVTRKSVEDAYCENLQEVLKELEILLSNVDAKNTVISADHGNAFGEWGIYGHPYGVPISCVRTVPWVKATASDNNTYTPNTSKKVNDAEKSVEDKLKSLGYL